MSGTIVNIRKYMGMWRKYTYRQGMSYCEELKKDKDLSDMCRKVLREQGLSETYMTGRSVEKLPVKNEGKVDIIFSELFYKEIENNYITPAKYIADIVTQCRKNHINDIHTIAGIAGRGLRAFPSFVREMDLAYKLSQAFPGAGCQRTDAVRDVRDHTDVIMEYGGETYRIWSYQSSERGLQNTASRVLGNRGALLDGKHVLCPFNARNACEYEEQDGWYFYTEEYVRKVKAVIVANHPVLYREIKNRRTEEVKKYLKNIGMFLK